MATHKIDRLVDANGDEFVFSDSSKAEAEKAVRDAINALDSNKTSTDGTNVQVKVTETDGKISSVNITTDNTENRNNKVTAWSGTTTDAHYPSEKLVKASLDGKASSTHTHGNITSGGTLQTNDITIANGDKLVVTDSSDSSKVARASIAFDGSTTTKALTQKGTFEAFAKSGDITTAIQALDVSSVGGDGKYISAISETDGKISAAATTMDTTPTANSTKAVTSGGIKTALDGKQDSLPTSGTVRSTYAINISGNSTSANNWHGSIYGIAKSAKTKRYVYLGRKKRSDYGCLIGILTVCSHTDSMDVYVIGSGWSNGNFGRDASVQRITSGRAGAPSNICLYNHEITENDTVYSELWCYIPTNSGEVDFIFRTLFNFGGRMTLAASVVNCAESEFTGTLTKCANSNSRNISHSPTNTAVGSASVPVYVTNSGAVTACTDDFVHDGDVTSTYSSTGTAPVNGTAVAAAIGGLDVSNITGFGAGKTLATLKEENGKISATLQDISITKSQVSDFSHTHGNIQNGGTLQTNDITIANGDKLVVTDASDSNKVARASLTFDGATTDQMLSKKGEWNDTIAKARAVVDCGSSSKAIEIGWSGAAITSPTYFAVYTDSAHGYNKAIKDCSLANVRKAVNGTSVGSAAVPVFINANGETQVCTDDFVHAGDIASLNDKLNVDGSNATTVGVTAMMRQVESGSGGLDYNSFYFGDSNDDHKKIVRRPVSDLWNYIKEHVKTNILGSVGGSDKPIYLENGVPKVCADGVPFSFYNYGKSVGYGVFVGGNTTLSKSTRCSCTFLVSVSSNPDIMMHTYIGTFSFRGDLSNKIMKKELRCLTGAPQYPLRMTVIYNVDGGTTEDPTYSVGLYVIPADKSYKYSTYRLTCIASSGFIWDVKHISETDYDNCDAISKNVFMTQTAMIKDVANESGTNDTSTVHIYYDDIICNNGSTAYTINISRLIIGKAYRFHIMKESQAATYLYNYGESGLGTITAYLGSETKGVTSNARIALNGGGTGSASHTVTVARMTENTVYIIWGY